MHKYYFLGLLCPPDLFPPHPLVGAAELQPVVFGSSKRRICGASLKATMPSREELMKLSTPSIWKGKSMLSRWSDSLLLSALMFHPKWLLFLYLESTRITVIRKYPVMPLHMLLLGFFTTTILFLFPHGISNLWQGLSFFHSQAQSSQAEALHGTFTPFLHKQGDEHCSFCNMQFHFQFPTRSVEIKYHKLKVSSEAQWGDSSVLEQVVIQDCLEHICLNYVCVCTLMHVNVHVHPSSESKKKLEHGSN